MPKEKPRFQTSDDVKVYFKDVESPLVEAILFILEKCDETYKYVNKLDDEIRGYDP